MAELDIDKIIRQAMGARIEEHILLIRELFKALPEPQQAKQLKKMVLESQGRKAIYMISLENENQAMRFETISDILKWLRAAGYKRASTSNIYKVLQGERKSCYGHRFEYEE